MKAFIFNTTNIDELNKLFDQGYSIKSEVHLGGANILFILQKD